MGVRTSSNRRDVIYECTQTWSMEIQICEVVAFLESIRIPRFKNKHFITLCVLALKFKNKLWLVHLCSEWRCIWQYSGSFGLFYWTLVSFHGNLVSTKGTSQRDNKLVSFCVHDCQSPIFSRFGYKKRYTINREHQISESDLN